MTRKKIASLLFILAIISAIYSCKKKGCTDPDAINYKALAKKDDGSCIYNTAQWTDITIGGTTYRQLAGDITTDLTITASDNWTLSGGVFVTSGITLTIEPGATIYAANDGTTPFLAVDQGGTIMACGTAESPIVFTTFDDAKIPGSWGGIILNGYAPINTGSTAEGEGGTGTYGGNDPEDSSGMLCYVRVEYAGKILGTDNELNGFSFNGCGSGTELHHLQAYKGADDGFEFFGGTVSLRYALSSGNQDDSFDWTHGWSGNGQFWVVEQDASGGDRGLEADNNGDNNSITPVSNPQVSNVTLVGLNDGDDSNQGILFREGTRGQVMNVIVTNFPIRGCQVMHDITLTNMDNNTLRFTNTIIDNVNPFTFTTSAGTTATGINTFADAINENTIASDGSLIGFLSGYVGVSTSGAGDPTTWGAWFEPGSFIGAVPTEDDWTEGWTIDL